MSNKYLSYPKAIELVLSSAKTPLSMFEIEREIVKRELIKKVNSSSIRHAIYKDLDKKDASIFFQIEYNLYTLRNPDVAKDVNNLPILVFDSKRLDELGYFHTINKDFQTYINGILKVDQPVFMPRGRVEGNPSYKQVVSYVLISYKGKLLRFTRHEYKRNRNLELIDGKYSLGFGGHVQAEDLNLFTVGDNDSGYTASLYRELREETGIEKQDIKEIKTIGVLNDDSTIKGKCHFAFLHLAELATPKFKDTEKWVIKPELVSFEQIKSEFENYEYWSKLCMQHYFTKEMKNRKFNCYIDNRRGVSLRKNHPYLAIVGEIGSGKSQICSLLVEQYGYVRVPCSQILQNLMRWKPKTNNIRRELQNAGFKYINKKGAHKRFAKRIVDYIKTMPSNKTILIDGLRYAETYLELQKTLDIKHIPLIYVESNRENQYRNFMSREKSTISIREFTEILEHPVEKSVGKFLEYSDIIIFNFGSIESILEEVNNYLHGEHSNSFLVEAWDNNAAHRHAQILSGHDLTFDNITTPFFLTKIKEQKNYSALKILDVGCGTGVLTNLIAEHVKKVVAIDHSPLSIQIAQGFTHNTNINFVCESIEDFSLEGDFDIAIANMAFHSIDNIDTALKNIYISLKPNGKLIFSLPHPFFYPERKRLKEIFKSTGYEYDKPSFHKIPFTISLEPDPLPNPIPYFHRPESLYDSLLIQNGFWVTEKIVPLPSRELIRKYKNKWDAPHLFFGVAIKP